MNKAKTNKKEIEKKEVTSHKLIQKGISAKLRPKNHFLQ